MKNFLIEFFIPLDNLSFNYFVKIGAIKPFLEAIAGSVVSGLCGSRSAARAARRSAATIERAYGELRDPSEIISEAYQTGIYSPETMGAILGAEREFIS